MERVQLPEAPLAIALPQWRLAYVPTLKAGCTSLLWALADLQGEDTARFERTIVPEVTRALAIHDRSRWAKTVLLRELSDADLRAVHPDNGWFIFAMSRHPIARLWSAWQSKLLLREPLFAARFEDREWFPRIPETLAEVQEDFEKHVAALPGEQALIDADPHWLPQHRVLSTSVTDYTHIGKVESIEATYNAIEAHLHTQGWSGHLARPHENRSMLPLLHQWVTPTVRSVVERVYQADYELFGYPAGPPISFGKGGSEAEEFLLSRGLLRAIPQLIARHERIADLSRTASALTDALTGAEARLELERRLLEQANAEIAHDLADERSEREAAVYELDTLKRTRTFRYTAASRKLYSRWLRSRSRIAERS